MIEILTGHSHLTGHLQADIDDYLTCSTCHNSNEMVLHVLCFYELIVGLSYCHFGSQYITGHDSRVVKCPLPFISVASYKV